MCYCLGKPWSGSLPAMVRGGRAPNRSVVPQDNSAKGGSAMNSHYFTVALVLGSIAAGPLLAQETAPQDPTKMPQAELAKVQQALKQRGYDPGKVDGTWGSESTQALAAFQASRAIATTHGLIDSSTLHALHVAAPPKGEPVTDKPTESSVAPGGGTTGGTVNTQATAPGPPWAWPAAGERR